MNGRTRHGVATYTATRRDQITAVIDPTCGDVMVTLGSELDRHEFMLTPNAAAYLREALWLTTYGRDPEPDPIFTP